MSKILHRHGGEITAITHIGHTICHGIAEWFFIGDVRWNGHSESRGSQILPNYLCQDGDDPASHARILTLMAALNDYLSTFGTWHEPKHKRDGRIYSWTPHEKTGTKALS